MGQKPLTNHTWNLNRETNIQGPRLNPKLVGDLKESEQNILLKEQEVARELFGQILAMRDEGLIKHGREIELKVVRGNIEATGDKEEVLKEIEIAKQLQKDTGRPVFTTHEENLAIAGRLLNYDMLWTMVNKRFHQCLKQETDSAVRMNQIAKLDDQDLVRTICPRERLTLYNFLKTHLADQHRSSAS